MALKILEPINDRHLVPPRPSLNYADSRQGYTGKKNDRWLFDGECECASPGPLQFTEQALAEAEFAIGFAASQTAHNIRVLFCPRRKRATIRRLERSICEVANRYTQSIEMSD